MNVYGSTESALENRYSLGRRRSVRMTLNAAVSLSGHDHQNCPFTLPAQASDLNRHGAAVQVNRHLSLGSTVVIRNKNSVQLSARIVTQSSATEGGSRTYGIEFA